VTMIYMKDMKGLCGQEIAARRIAVIGKGAEGRVGHVLSTFSMRPSLRIMILRSQGLECWFSVPRLRDSQAKKHSTMII